jgi:2-keto-4-pentenoate hydratase/2-oxohepta-3-ene-1,7-dioic acid hydratase in catechol pathway
MRWATFRSGEGVRVGLVLGERIHALEPGVQPLDLLGDDGELLAKAGQQAATNPRDVFDLSAVRLLPPLPRPTSVRDFYSFEQHVKTARERRGHPMSPVWYEEPVFYFGSPTAVVGANDPIPMPPGSSELDFELELCAIVGKGGRDLTSAEAEKCIAGYAIFNDWSARDHQRREWALTVGPAKGKDSASTFGPFLVTPDEIESYRSGYGYNLAMTARVNGVEYSRASWADIYWSFGEMLAVASRGADLVPGDVIASGTCGTGCILELALVHGADRYPYLTIGDEVELSVERIGTIKNRIVPGAKPIPVR